MSASAVHTIGRATGLALAFLFSSWASAASLDTPLSCQLARAQAPNPDAPGFGRLAGLGSVSLQARLTLTRTAAASESFAVTEIEFLVPKPPKVIAELARDALLQTRCAAAIGSPEVRTLEVPMFFVIDREVHDREVASCEPPAAPGPTIQDPKPNSWSLYRFTRVRDGKNTSMAVAYGGGNAVPAEFDKFASQVAEQRFPEHCLKPWEQSAEIWRVFPKNAKRLDGSVNSNALPASIALELQAITQVAISDCPIRASYQWKSPSLDARAQLVTETPLNNREIDRILASASARLAVPFSVGLRPEERMLRFDIACTVQNGKLILSN